MEGNESIGTLDFGLMIGVSIYFNVACQRLLLEAKYNRNQREVTKLDSE